MLNPLTSGISEVFINGKFLGILGAMLWALTKKVGPTPFMRAQSTATRLPKFLFFINNS